jgi:hypothetical protein
MDPRETTPPPEAEHAAPDGADWNGASWDWRSEFRDDQPPGRRAPLPDAAAVFALLDAIRRMVPPELQEQFAALQRELLLTVRALIDWYLERLDQRARPVRVEDIPIE